MTLQNGGSYLVYSYSDLKAWQTVCVSIVGKAASARSNEKTSNPFAIGAAFLGFAIIGTGVWWWRRPDETDEETTDQPDVEMDFDRIINEIAHLDEAHEKGDIQERVGWRVAELMARVKYALSPPEDVVFVPDEDAILPTKTVTQSTPLTFN